MGPAAWKRAAADWLLPPVFLLIHPSGETTLECSDSGLCTIDIAGFSEGTLTAYCKTGSCTQPATLLV